MFNFFIGEVYTTHSVASSITDNCIHVQCHYTASSPRTVSVAVCLLLVLDGDLEPEAGIEMLRELKGPAAIQSVKVLWWWWC